MASRVFAGLNRLFASIVLASAGPDQYKNALSRTATWVYRPSAKMPDPEEASDEEVAMCSLWPDL